MLCGIKDRKHYRLQQGKKGLFNQTMKVPVYYMGFTFEYLQWRLYTKFEVLKWDFWEEQGFA